MDSLASFHLRISTREGHRSRKRLHVHIWKNLKDLRRAARASSTKSARYWKNALGAYVGVRKGNQFGEIHLWINMLGAGYWAHELQHFMMDYATATEPIYYESDTEANERMAWLAGELTAEFWTKFYERLEMKEG